MGYYTTYQIEVVEGDKDLIRQLRDENENTAYAFDDTGACQEECKWYESDDEMKEFSKKHPEALFLLEGEGEESGDLWRQYWRNGKVQTISARIEYDDYDETKMEELKP